MLNTNPYVTYTAEGRILLPNIKKMFLPDEGKEIADIDLSGADIQVVACDSECKWLLDFFSGKQDKKVYAYIASEYFQRDISDKSDEYKTYKGVFHGTNYLLGIAKLAKMAGISEQLAKGLQDFYFKLNPEVREWHKRLENDIKNKGYVQNKFGRRMQFNYATRRFNPNLMNEVAAAIPQSTIADLINRIWVAIAKSLPQVDILMQVHDSLVLQYDLEIAVETRSAILEVAKIAVPYNPPLYIGSDIKVSSSSYGETSKPMKLII